MKKLLLSCAFIFCTYLTNAQSLAVNGTGASADASAILDVQSTSKGLLVPRMTAAEKALIASPATGLTIYQTDGSTGFYTYNGSGWISLLNGGSTLDASKLTTGTVPTARLGSGTADGTTYLRGDGTWAAPAGGGAVAPLFLTKSEDYTITSSDAANDVHIKCTGLAPVNFTLPPANSLYPGTKIYLHGASTVYPNINAIVTGSDLIFTYAGTSDGISNFQEGTGYYTMWLILTSDGISSWYATSYY